MSVICPKCGCELPDNAKFCGSCGTNLADLKISAKNICINCGSKLKDGAKFCNVCGTKVMSAAQEDPKPEAKTEQPTTDKPVSPVTTDNTFAEQGQASEKATAPDSQQPDVQGINTAPINDNLNSFTSSAAATSVIDDNYGGVKTEERPRQPESQQNQHQATSQDPSASAAAITQNAQQNNYENVPNNQPYPDPGQQTVTPGKSPSILIPIILIILILAVIAVDVFVLFPDRIFGERNESSSEEAVAVTYFLDE